MTIQLSPTQHAILAHAIEHTEGKITWFPDNIKGGARQKVLDGLLIRALISAHRQDWFVTAEGYQALGIPRRGPITDDSLEEAVQAAEASWNKEPTKTRTRDNSKQAQIIAMLKRPDGATIAQICEATGWQAHTVRGTFAGAFKKKLGLVIVSNKSSAGDRVYRIAANPSNLV
jgi:hypothetical protein